MPTVARRLLRYLFHVLAVPSLVLCVGVCVLWARSYWVQDALGRQWRDDEWWEFASARGTIYLSHGLRFPRWRPPAPPEGLYVQPRDLEYFRTAGGRVRQWRELAGVGFYASDLTSPSGQTYARDR